MDIYFSHPEIRAHIDRSYAHLYSTNNCFLLTTKFEKVTMFSQGAGSVKHFILFHRHLSNPVMAQMRTGYSPTPYEDNDLASYYYLDGSDISYNQEKVFN